MTEFWQGASDFISAHWGEVIAIFTSSGVGIVLIRFLLNLILARVNAKNTKKINAPLIAKFEEIKAQVDTMEAKVKLAFEEGVKNYTQIIRDEFSALMAKYQEVKQEIYKGVVEGNEEVEQLLTELENVIVEVNEKVEEIAENEIAEIKAEETKVEEEVKESANIENLTEKTENSSEYVVVEKTYGE